jgi:hypothetical protein
MRLLHCTATVKAGRILELAEEADALHLELGQTVAIQFAPIHTEALPPIENTPAPPGVDSESAAVIALMDEWLAGAPTDPEEISQAKADVDNLMQNLNRNRIESGESSLLWAPPTVAYVGNRARNRAP